VGTAASETVTGRAGGSAVGEPMTVALLPLMAVVLAGFTLIGAAMPVLALHVYDGFGFGPLMVGGVAGFQFASALPARLWAGGVAGRNGPKHVVMLGLVASATGLGAVSLISATIVVCAVGVCLPVARGRAA
jgi:hypothetical protein